MPKISVIMPSLNVGKYIEQCIKSVVNQTLKDIEIICIDAGSTDNTLEILHKYAAKDPRIKIIISDIKSYGYQMNLGLDNSSGKYIGIVETDDFAELNMFENMCNIADKENAEIVRANYYWHTSKPKKQDVFFENLAKCPYNQVFSPEENRVFFTVTPSIWSAIYKKEFISKFNIRFNETPGASYQDTSFHFSVATMAEKVFLVKEPYIHYRKDNDNSSVNSKSKVYCVRDEMHYYEEFLNIYPEKKKKIFPYFMALKYEKYRWNYERLAAEYQYEFLELMYKEFLESRKNGLLDERNFGNAAWDSLQKILKSPRAYFNETGKICCTQFNSLNKKDFNIVKKASYRSAKISIIIPVYNSEAFICQTLNSVLAQTLYDIEVICINDGSSDNSIDIILEYAKQDHRVTVISQINKGLSSARNAGLDIAGGEYVYFLDSDDMIEPNSLEELYMLAQERDVAVLYFDGKPFYESEELEKKYSIYDTAYKLKNKLPDILTGQELFCKMIESNSYRCSPCLQLIRRDYLERICLRFPVGILHEDNLFNFICMLSADRVSHTKNTYFLRRLRHNSIMTKPKHFYNMYGYLRCYIGMLSFAGSLPYNRELYNAINIELDYLKTTIKRMYSYLSDKNKYLKKLSELEMLWLTNLIQPIPNEQKRIDEVELIRMSWSYKIGRIITWAPRKTRSAIRCLKVNGIKYTFNIVKSKLLGSTD